MLGTLRKIADQVMGRGAASITVPAFDGALKPNKLLDSAESIAQSDALGDLASDGVSLFVADGPALMMLGTSGLSELCRFDAPITALSCLADGGLAIALDGREVRVFDAPKAGTARSVYSGLTCVNALACDGAGGVYATVGSSKYGVDDWVWDLMELGQTGRFLHLGSDGKVSTRRDHMRYAFGAARDGSRALVSEPWAHRLVRIGDGTPEIALDRLPIYPSRLTAAADGGWWLTGFTARTQLVEFVLREPAFRKRMMAELHPDHWVAPRLRTGRTIMEPMQAAHLKTMGVTKPWAPPRSYGIIIRLGADARPIFSAHSRVDGAVHGITATAEHNGHLYFIAKGPEQLMRLPLAQLTPEGQP